MEYLLALYSTHNLDNPLVKLKVPAPAQTSQEESQEELHKVLKMLAMIFLNITRALELKGQCYFAEVVARACFLNMEDSGFNDKDEMVDFIGNFYNFIKEKASGC